MKKTIFISFLAFLLISEAKSQEFEVGFGLGSGAVYLFEDYDSGINIDYSLPFSSYVDLKYGKSENYFGVKLRFQYLNAGIKGNDWKNPNLEIDGEVSSLTTLFLLEHLPSNQNWSFGYNFGLGYTHQLFRPDLINSSDGIRSSFISFHLGGILRKKVNENFSLQLEPSLFWTDPVNSFRNSDKWQIAGEDLSVLVQFGMVYQFN
ncbi:MAG: hypothetical protein LAT51_09370 [Flavobacteriaceae bacterium]|nr:hypothetical protein [Flavobacteriaceae bacterium]